MQTQLLIQRRPPPRGKYSRGKPAQKEDAEGEELSVGFEVFAQVLIANLIQIEDDSRRIHGFLYRSGEEGHR